MEWGDDTIALLLVEDDPVDARLLVQLLDHSDVCSYGMQTVGTVADAERQLTESRFDCVLLDLSLPDCDGLTSVQRVLSIAPRTPIVVLTGRDDYELGLQSIEAGAQDFIVKGEVKGNTILRCAQWAVARVAAAPLPSDEKTRWGVLDDAVAGIALVDLELKVVVANPTFVDLVGLSAAVLAETSLTNLVEVDDIVSFVLDLRATLRNEAPVRLMEAELRTAGGGRVAGRMNVARVAPADAEPSLLLVFSPVSRE